MNKKLLALILGISVLVSNSAGLVTAEETSEDTTQKKEFEYDFKTFRWGDTREDVEAKEGEPLTEGDMDSVDAHYIAYKTTVASKDAILAYYFCDDGLYQTRYLLSEEHSNENLFIDDYEDVKSALTKKYGEPLIDHESWQDDDKESYYADRKGDALSYGYLTYWTWYSLDRTDIFMNMSADNYDVTTTIDFDSTEISPGEADYSDDF